MRRFVAALALSLSLALPAAVAARPEAPAEPAPFKVRPLSIGSSWYPEQWPEARWEADLALMAQAHLSIVRVGEFAWARMEPTDGAFDFAWLDRAIAAASRHGLRVVIGTPTAAPPIWLTETHADVRRVDEDGTVQGHGERRQFSVASATYRRYAARIAAELAQRYGHNPAVVGWQIDNEIGLESFDAGAKAQWADWLAARYGTIAALNTRWATQYWSQHYQRFDQVPLTLGRDQNPALVLDARRFYSHLWADYVAAQAAAIRAHADPRQFVTTNSTAWNDHFDQATVHRGLDLAAWDEYVPDGRPDWAALALHNDVVRGYLRRNFWVMETQPGHVNWGANNRSLDPGETRMLAWQAMAHGADALLYWQWRSAPGGQEQYHGTLVGADGTPMPVYDEIARTAAEFERVSSILADTIPVARVAMLYSQDSRWAIEQQRFAKDYDPVAVMKAWYRPLHARGLTVDVVPPDADLTGYALVLAPGLNVIDAALAARLDRYVRNGGQLVLGPRSGMKDGDNALWPQRQPGPLAALLGARVDDFYALDAPVPVVGLGTAMVETWAETLTPTTPDTTVVLRYGTTNGWLAGKPMMLARPVGAGEIIYVGGSLDDVGQAALTQKLIDRADLPATMLLPLAVEIAERVGRAGRFAIVINHSNVPVPVPFPQTTDPLVGDGVNGVLPPHGVALFHLSSVPVLRQPLPAEPPAP
ncbi:MAG: beta-galactosidase [Sphingomonas bacterium]|nr:beta-galactosidase [Sphingomonas bacterium]